MPSVNRILDRRADRITPAQRRRALALSILVHGGVVGGMFAATVLGEDPPEKRRIAPVIRLVTPAAVGIKRPPPPPPPPPKPAPPPPPTRVVPPPPPPPRAADTPVIPVKKKVDPKPVPAPPPPEPPPPATPEPPKPRGVLRGNPLGSNTSTTIGVEDPDFTYGYYERQLIAALGANWRRPPVPQRIKDATFYFRIRRDGSTFNLELIESSGSTVFDDAARRAIEIAKLPPLPRSYDKDYLGITVLMR